VVRDASTPPSRGERRRVEGAGAPEAIVEFLVERRLL